MFKYFVAIVLIVMVACAAGVLYLGTGTIAPEDTQIVSRGLIHKVARGSGQVEGIEPPPLCFPMPGYLTEVFVVEGQEVEPNEVLAELSPEEFKIQYAQAESKLNESQAKLELAKLKRNDAQIRQAEENINLVANDVKLAELKLKNLQNPPVPPPAAFSQIEEATRSIEKARQNLLLAQAAMKQLKVSSPDQIAVAQNKLAAKETELANAQNQPQTAANTANVERLQKEAEVARAEYDMVKRGARPEEIEAAQARVNLAKLEVEGAEKAKIRLEKPEAPPPAPKYEIEQASIALEQARAREGQARAALEDMKRGPEPAEIRAAEAARDQAQSAVKELALRREGLKLRAPSFGGRILKRHVEPGIMVSDHTPIITLVDFSKKRVRAEFDVAKLSEIGKGVKQLPVTLSSRAFKVDLEGKIERIVGVGTRKIASEDPAAPRGGEVVEVLISLDEPKGELQKESFAVLMPGLRVDAVITLEQRDKVLCVPKTFVSHDADKSYVLRFDRAVPGTTETASRLDVKCGMYDEANIEIISGLNEGDKIMKPKPMNLH